ncbi:MAG: YdcF family protein [Paraclostridium sp.]
MMNVLLIIGIIMSVVGCVLLKVERRSFLTGITLIGGVSFILMYAISVLSESNDISRTITLGLVYGLVPLLIIAGGVFLIKNGKSMITKEGRKLANLLSLIIGVYIFVIIFLIYILFKYNMHLNPYIYIAIKLVIVVASYVGILFLIYLSYSYLYQKLPVNKDIDYIIVLGSGLIGDRVPPLLKSRLDKGIEIYNKQIRKGVNCKMIVSGGQGPDELVSEASAMGKYLLSQGIKESDVILEDKSTTTYENMKFSKNIMDKSSKYNSIFVTNNYHVFRASIFARKVGLKANGVGAPTAFYFLPSALIREFIAILVIYKWISIIFILIVLFLVAWSIFPL